MRILSVVKSVPSAPFDLCTSARVSCVASMVFSTITDIYYQTLSRAGAASCKRLESVIRKSSHCWLSGMGVSPSRATGEEKHIGLRETLVEVGGFLGGNGASRFSRDRKSCEVIGQWMVWYILQ